MIRRLARALQRSQPDIRSIITDDGYIVATNNATLPALSATSGDSLGQRAVFRRALPDVADARMALWIGVRPLVSSDGADGSFRMRLVAD